MVQPGSIRVDNPGLVRHQPVGLMQSACYIRSNGALTCLTCHDPHARTSEDRLSYEAICLSCHQSTSQGSCPISARADCLNCHMPRRDVTRGMMMTDHWIRIVPDRGAHRD
jgi:predicted CXXCH cytochrome family protein